MIKVNSVETALNGSLLIVANFVETVIFHACLVHLTVFGSFWYNFVVPIETGVSTIHEAVTITTTGTKTRLLRISVWKCPSKQIRFFFSGNTSSAHEYDTRFIS